MLPYWILFAVFAFGAIRNSRHGTEEQKPTIVFRLALIGLVLMIGLRFEVGGDWGHYLGFFRRMSIFDFDRAITMGDPSYAAINWLVRRADFSMGIVNLLCATIFVIGLGTFARRQPNPWLAILVAVPYLIIVVAMGYTRQAAAMGFVMWGLAAFDRGQMQKFGATILGAVTFHLTAIVALPMGVMAVTRNRMVTYAMLLLLGASLYVIFVRGDVDRLFTVYVDAKYASQGALTRVAMNIPAATFFLLARRRFGMSPESTKLWTNMSIAAFACLAMLAFTSASTAVDRLALYLIPLQIVVLSRIPAYFAKSNAEKLGLTALIVALSAVIQFVWLNYAQHVEYWLPYNNYLWA